MSMKYVPFAMMCLKGSSEIRVVTAQLELAVLDSCETVDSVSPVRVIESFLTLPNETITHAIGCRVTEILVRVVLLVLPP